MVCCGRMGHQPSEIQRTSRFRAGARQTPTTERLHPYHRPNDVAIDIEITGLDPARDMLDRFIEPRMQAEGQAVTASIDVADEIVNLGAFVAEHVQRGAEKPHAPKPTFDRFR